MLITQSEEISAYLPTSLFEGAGRLLSVIEDAEENYLVPILGRSLYNKVGELYKQILAEYGGSMPTDIPMDDGGKDIRLVRMCQMPVLYFALANSTGLLSVSFNNMGLHQPSTNGMDAADAKAVERFRTDAYFKARRGIDSLLVFLEEDAQSQEKKFSNLWKESSYFYLQGDLLFTTAIEMNRFINIESSREKFISLLPDIRYCQDTYLAPAIGYDLLEAIVKSSTDGAIMPKTDTSAFTWRKTKDYLRMALAIFVENRRPEKQRRYSENEASMSLSRAKEFIASRQDDFGDHIKKSPLYTATKVSQSTQQPGSVYDPSDPSNAIHTPFLMPVNRH